MECIESNYVTRTLVLVDIENLVGGPGAPDSALRAGVQAVSQMMESCESGSQMIVACSHFMAARVAFEFPCARQLWRSGENGADEALLEVIAAESISERFAKVILVSGDGIFADSVAALGGAGVRVETVASEGTLSRTLRMASAVSICIDINESTTDEGAA